jgi:ABC-type phosphate transport system substrate-binding protein
LRTPKKLATGLAILASAAALTTLAAGPALADPPTSVTPLLTDIVGAGADTPLFDQLSADYNATSPASSLYSWDEVNPLDHAVGDPITAKGDGFSDTTCSITRPDGSSAGITALENSKVESGDYCVDFAPGTRAPVVSDPGSIAFAVMAGDAITWATPAGSPAPATLAESDLLSIYTCQDTNWSQVGGGNVPIVPVLPAAGSGTRDTFLLDLGALDGLPPGTQLTPGSCVNNGTDPVSGLPVEENTGLGTGNQNVFGNADTVFPYSIADYIAQGPAATGTGTPGTPGGATVGGHATAIWGHGVLVLHDMTDDSGTVQAPTATNSSGQVVINPGFPFEMQRVIYNAVRNGGTAAAPAFPATPAYEATALPAIFGPGGWVCTSPTAQADLISYGFYSQGANCGTLITPPQEPALTDIVGVGADTTFPLFSGSQTTQTSGDLTQDYNTTSPANKLYSWGAVNPATGEGGDTIITKASSPGDTNCSMLRPDGSDSGIEQLNLGQTDGGDPCIDYVLSSRAPNTTTFNDAFTPLATDAIDWSYPVISGQASPQPTKLTHAELVSIYTCADTNWDQVGGANAPIVPVLPYSGSGTRITWLTDLGITATSEPCWVNGTAANDALIEENTGLSSGNADQFTSAGAQDDIFPYSIGDWIAQGSPAKGTGTAGTPGGATVGGHALPFWGHGNLALGETLNALGVAEAPVTTNTDSQPVINPSWSTQFTRTLYAVVRNGYSDPTGPTDVSWPTTPAYEATALPAVFGPGGWVCTSATAQSDIVSYGFGLETSANCGSLTAGD